MRAVGFQLSFCRLAALHLKKRSATPLSCHPLARHFRGPARACQSLANIFAFPSACVSSFGSGGLPAGLAPTTYSCAAVANFLLQWLARGRRAMHCFFFVVSSGTYFACSSSCRAFAFRGCPKMFSVVVLGHAFVPALAGKAEGPRGYVNNVDVSSRGRRLRLPILSRMVLRSATFMFCSTGQAAGVFNLAMQRPRAATPAICFSPRSPLLKRITGCISQ